jgi:hypothetical protein
MAKKRNARVITDQVTQYFNQDMKRISREIAYGTAGQVFSDTGFEVPAEEVNEMVMQIRNAIHEVIGVSVQAWVDRAPYVNPYSKKAGFKPPTRESRLREAVRCHLKEMEDK